MSVDNSSPASARTATVKDLVVLKSPEEGGTKKVYEDFLEKIQNHLMIGWNGGRDIGYLVKNNAAPIIPEPVDLSAEDQKSAWKQLAWEETVKDYVKQVKTLRENESSLYSLLMANLSSITKGKVKSKGGYQKAEDDNNPLWLLSTLEDIMVNFEEVEKPEIAIDNLLEV